MPANKLMKFTLDNPNHLSPLRNSMDPPGQPMNAAVDISNRQRIVDLRKSSDSINSVDHPSQIKQNNNGMITKPLLNQINSARDLPEPNLRDLSPRQIHAKESPAMSPTMLTAEMPTEVILSNNLKKVHEPKNALSNIF